MADGRVSQTFSENPDLQEKRVSGDDSTPSQEQQSNPGRLQQRMKLQSTLQSCRA